MNTWQFPRHYNTIGQSICLHTFAKIQLSHHYKLLKILTTYRTTPTCCNHETNATDKSTHTRRSSKPSVPIITFSNWHTNRPNGINYWHLVRKSLTQSRNEQRIKAGKSHPWTIYQISSPPLFAASTAKTDSITLRSTRNKWPPKGTFLQSPQRHTHKHTRARTHTHIHACTHLQTHIRIQTHTHTHTNTHTHIHTRARMQEHTFCIYSLPTTSAQTHKSQVNFKRFQLAPLTQIINTDTPSFIRYHRC